jgi:hypothetical protein
MLILTAILTSDEIVRELELAQLTYHTGTSASGTEFLTICVFSVAFRVFPSETARNS